MTTLLDNSNYMVIPHILNCLAFQNDNHRKHPLIVSGKGFKAIL